MEVDVEFDESNDFVSFDGERCGICMDIVVDRGLLDCCQHWFCFGCIDNWATITNVCPLCQAEFQLITCVPVYETMGNSKVDEDSFSRDDDWSVEGTDTTVSFPSYYIDENAVTCLDGDGCKIRSGSLSIEEDPNLDTSIACDSCDIWYHAFCVGFDTEGTSEETWLCPRCAVGEEQQNPVASSLQRTTTHSHPESSKSEWFPENVFSGKMSVSIADAGETAVVISMVGENISTGEPSEKFPFFSDIKMEPEGNAVIQEGGSHKAEVPSFQHTDLQLVPKTGVLPSHLSHDASFNLPSSSLVISDLNTDCKSYAKFDPSLNSSRKLFNDSETRPKSSEGEFCSDLDNVILLDGNNEDVKVIGRKRLHEDCSENFLEDTGDEEIKAGNDTVFAKRIRVEEDLQISTGDKARAFLPDDSPKCRMPPVVAKDVEAKVPSEKEDAASCIMSIVKGTGRRITKVNQNSVTKSAKEKENLAGLRVKKIMRRVIEAKDSSAVFEELREKIREAVRNKASPNFGKNLFDPKLLAAFRSAVAGATTEQITKLPASSIKAKKAMMQKGKIRENLTKKIYADSNGKRRRAWDRECEVEFWKHRSMRPTKPEKLATLKSVLNLLRSNPKAPEVEQPSESQAENPILSRLYLADTSVFPRKDDIEPLSSAQDGDVKSTSANPVSWMPSFSSTNEVKSKVPSTKDKPAVNKAQTNKVSEGPRLGDSRVNSKKKGDAQSNGKVLDKRKWALEVLARKKGLAGKSAGQENQEDNALLKGNYPLLAQLPADMKPVLVPCQHNKISLSIRQAHLYRLTEHFLKKANLPEIRRTAETELAVADAVNIEKEVADKSSSKLVYMNLCSQEILRRSDTSNSTRSTTTDFSSSTAPNGPSSSPSSGFLADRSQQPSNELPTDPAAVDALRAAGLLSDSPPSSPHHKLGESNELEDLPLQRKEEGPDNILDNDSCPKVDTDNDLVHDLENKEPVGTTAVKAPELQSEDTDSRIKYETSNNIQDLKELKDSPSLLSSQTDTGSVGLTLESGTDKSCVTPESRPGEESAQPSIAESEELHGPDKEPSNNKFPEEASMKLHELVDAEAPADNNSMPGKVGSNESSQPENANGEKSANRSETSKKVSNRDESIAETAKKHDVVNSVSKKVEAYIKEHIRPLCKSGIITTEQYRWAVAKATDKVMKYHPNAKNANFLIKEGDKVKKLSEQYVEAAQHKGKNDML